MKICFPVERNEGLKSPVFGHFGSAPLFLIIDTASGAVTAVSNQDEGHEHGKCSPMKALAGAKPDLVIVGGIGQGAITKLRLAGIRVFRSAGQTIQENLDQHSTGALSEFADSHTCAGHGTGGCGHDAPGRTGVRKPVPPR